MKVMLIIFSCVFLIIPVLSVNEIKNNNDELCYKEAGLDTLVFGRCYRSVLDELQKGADVNQLEVGESALTIAVSNNDIKMVNLLIAHGAKVHYECAAYPCYSPYIMALYDGLLEIVKIFIENGAPVNLLIKQPFGGLYSSTLFRAVQSGNVKLVKYMVDQGADITGFGGHNPVLAIDTLPVLNYFIRKKMKLDAIYEDSGDTLLHVLSDKGAFDWEEGERRKVIKRLISIGFDINILDFSGRTPLYASVLGNNIETVKLLVKLGADINLADERGLTPLAVAKRDKYKELVLYLESIGATE